jgi:ribonuclease R
VYLPGKTVPMLPEALSTGICSLNPGAERLAVVVSMELDSHGAVAKCEHFRAVIVSHARLTYRQVADVMEADAVVTGKAPLVANLEALKAVYGLLLGQRKARGVFDFENAEPSLRVTESGEFTLVWEHRTVAHKLIEELMLLTNQSVARLVFERHGVGMFRHQPLPDQEDWAEFVQWAQPRGYRLPAEPSLKAMSLLPGQARDAEERAIVGFRMRQVMNPAKYDTQEPAHFSLGFANYAQFTSPVRRYADLCVHRLLLGEMGLDEVLQASAVQCSERARAARLTERHVWDRLKKRILAREVPKTESLKAMAVSMSRRGLRVVIEAWQCSAFVPAQDLMDEGFVWSMDLEVWTRDGAPIELGSWFTVRWTALEEEVGRVDLTAALA